MDIHRRRPFKFVSEDAEVDEDNTILDEQEQDEVIQKLRDENMKSNKLYILLMQLLVSLSFTLYLSYLLNPADEPLSVLFPSTSIDLDLPIPLPRQFTLVSLFLHLNMLLVLDPNPMRTLLLHIHLEDSMCFYMQPLPFTFSYALALVAPTISFILGRSWLTIAWWSITAVIIFAVQTVQESIQHGEESISALEAMKYTAPGA